MIPVEQKPLGCREVWSSACIRLDKGVLKFINMHKSVSQMFIVKTLVDWQRFY